MALRDITSALWREMCDEWPDRLFCLLDAALADQAEISAAEALDMVGPKTFPPLRRRKFHPLRFSPFDVREPFRLMDGSALLGGSGTLNGRVAGGGWALPAPDGLRSASYISTSPDGAKTMLEAGRDYRVDLVRGQIVFKDNPLALPVTWERGIEGRTGRLWLLDCLFDDGTAARLSKVFAGVEVPAGERSTDLVGALHDMLAHGPSAAAVGTALCAALGCDAAKADGEVEAVFEEAGRSWVLAGGLLHSDSNGRAASVEEGGQARRGGMLFDSITLLGRGDALDSSKVTALFIGPGLTGGRLKSGVVLANADLPAPATRWLVASRNGGAALVEDVTERTYEYLVEKIQGEDVYLLVDDALDDYKLVRGSDGPACTGPAADVAAYKAFVHEGEASGRSFPETLAGGGVEPALSNPAAEVWARGLSSMCSLAVVPGSHPPEAWLAVDRVCSLMPAWSMLLVATEDSYTESLSASGWAESLDVFDCVDVDEASASVSDSIKTTGLPS